MAKIDREKQGWLHNMGMAQPTPAWGMGDVLAGLLVLALAVLILASGIASVLVGSPSFFTAGALVAGWSIGLGVVAGYVWLVRRRTPIERADLALESGLLPLPFVLLLGVAFGLTLDLAIFLGGGGFGRVAELRGLGVNVPDVVLATVLMVIAQPLAHGLLFTGVILPRLRASWGAWAGNIATMALFTVYHWGVYGVNLPAEQVGWYGIFFPFGLMFCLVMVRLRTYSTRATIIAHAGAGLVAVLAMVTLG